MSDESKKNASGSDSLDELVRCPMCGDPMTLEEHPTQGELYWECGFCDEMIPNDQDQRQEGASYGKTN